MPWSRIRTAWSSQSRAIRELAILVAALVFGVFAMPLIIHAAGREGLGAYENGGPAALLLDFLRGLAGGLAAFWAVALGPYAFILLGRLAFAVARRQRAEHREV
ncbi:MAG: hypothetical protein ACRETX_05515 [Steroidobacteraceae bacterium]